MLKKLLGGKKPFTLDERHKLVCDMHSHLIPGLDDGSPDIATSIELIREMEALGYKKLITTPHIMSDLYRNTPDLIYRGFSELAKSLVDQNIGVEIEVAGEYLIDDGFIQTLKRGELLTFGERYLLIELPYFFVPPMFNEVLFELQVAGYKIILAHPERYLYWHHDMGIYKGLSDRGVFLQLNMLSLTGYYSPKVKKIAERLIDLNLIDFLGSDLHNYQYLQNLKKCFDCPYLQRVLNSGNIRNNQL